MIEARSFTSFMRSSSLLCSPEQWNGQGPLCLGLLVEWGSYHRVVLQDADAVLMHGKPHTCTLLWRGCDGLRRYNGKGHIISVVVKANHTFVIV